MTEEIINLQWVVLFVGWGIVQALNADRQAKEGNKILSHISGILSSAAMLVALAIIVGVWGRT